MITLAGTPLSGETLSATVTDEDGFSGNIQYFWCADADVIAGASGSTFTLTDAQIWLPITVVK